MKALALLLAFTVLAALAAACAGGGDESASPSPAPSATVIAEWSAPLSAAVNDLARRSGAQAIGIVSVEPLDWPDACLGLPGPDEACAQVITPGLRVILSAAGRAYEYHTNLATHVRLVE
jgi:hypothetical protein